MFDEEWSFDTDRPPRRERQVLPPGMAEMEPGPELAARLEAVDPGDLNGHELVVLLQARSRQIAHLQAALYAEMWELAFTPPGYIDSPPHRTETLDEFASDEIAAALTLSPRAADTQLSRAFQLSELPDVRRALHRGEIDLDRARVFCRETGHLDSDQAHRVAESVLPHAPGLTSGQLAARLRRRCLQDFPEESRQRHLEAVAERRVETYSNPDGTADLLTRRLPLQRVASIMARINQIARQLQGHDDRTIDQIRADIVMDLLEGRDSHVARGGGGVEIRVDLTTLLELDERAGEISGWGPVVADLARQIVDQQPNTRWEAVITHPDSGQPLWTGTTKRRPTTAQERYVRARNPVCTFPGCPVPATRTHIDHTVDRAHGGPTVVANLGPLCARHHLRAKHRAGWQLRQIRPGTFHWTSPRGHAYLVRPPPT